MQVIAKPRAASHEDLRSWVNMANGMVCVNGTRVKIEDRRTVRLTNAQGGDDVPAADACAFVRNLHDEGFMDGDCTVEIS